MVNETDIIYSLLWKALEGMTPLKFPQTIDVVKIGNVSFEAQNTFGLFFMTSVSQTSAGTIVNLENNEITL